MALFDEAERMRERAFPNKVEREIAGILTALSGWPIDGKQMGALHAGLRHCPVEELARIKDVCRNAKQARPAPCERCQYSQAE